LRFGRGILPCLAANNTELDAARNHDIGQWGVCQGSALSSVRVPVARYRSDLLAPSLTARGAKSSTSLSTTVKRPSSPRLFFSCKPSTTETPRISSHCRPTTVTLRIRSSHSIVLRNPSRCRKSPRNPTPKSPRKFPTKTSTYSESIFCADILSPSTPQNTPANTAPISSHAQQPGVGTIKEGMYSKICPSPRFAPHANTLSKRILIAPQPPQSLRRTPNSSR
jgi:hypothetical protein